MRWQQLWALFGLQNLEEDARRGTILTPLQAALDPAARARIKREVDITVAPDANENSMILARSLAEKCGIRRKEVGRIKDAKGVRQRQYRLDPESVAAIFKDGQAYKERLIAGADWRPRTSQEIGQAYKGDILDDLMGFEGG